MRILIIILFCSWGITGIAGSDQILKKDSLIMNIKIESAVYCGGHFQWC